MSDVINHPAHYETAGVECIEAMEISQEDLKMLLNAKPTITTEPVDPIIEEIIPDELRDRKAAASGKGGRKCQT